MKNKKTPPILGRVIFAVPPKFVLYIFNGNLPVAINYCSEVGSKHLKIFQPKDFLSVNNA